MSLAKKYHRTCIVRSYCNLPPKKANWTDWTLHSTAKIFSSIGINYSIIRSYYTSDYWQPGALVSFFKYIPGLFVLCSLFLLRNVSPSSGCLPLSFRVPWLLFHMEHTFLSSPPASPLPSPSRTQCRTERRNKTAI